MIAYLSFSEGSSVDIGILGSAMLAESCSGSAVLLARRGICQCTISCLSTQMSARLQMARGRVCGHHAAVVLVSAIVPHASRLWG